MSRLPHCEIANLSRRKRLLSTNVTRMLRSRLPICAGRLYELGEISLVRLAEGCRGAAGSDADPTAALPGDAPIQSGA
jgi:hypothetical protein